MRGGGYLDGVRQPGNDIGVLCIQIRSQAVPTVSLGVRLEVKSAVRLARHSHTNGWSVLWMLYSTAEML